MTDSMMSRLWLQLRLPLRYRLVRGDCHVSTTVDSCATSGAGRIRPVGTRGAPVRTGRLGAWRPLARWTPEQQELAQRGRDFWVTGVSACFPAPSRTFLSRSRAKRVAPAARLDADCAIAISGVSTIGLGKAITRSRRYLSLEYRRQTACIDEHHERAECHRPLDYEPAGEGG